MSIALVRLLPTPAYTKQLTADPNQILYSAKGASNRPPDVPVNQECPSSAALHSAESLRKNSCQSLCIAHLSRSSRASPSLAEACTACWERSAASSRSSTSSSPNEPDHQVFFIWVRTDTRWYKGPVYCTGAVVAESARSGHTCSPLVRQVPQLRAAAHHNHPAVPASHGVVRDVDGHLPDACMTLPFRYVPLAARQHMICFLLRYICVRSS